MKTCTKCWRTKEKSDFGKCRESRDGLSTSCRKCLNSACQNYRKLRTPEKILSERTKKEKSLALFIRGFKMCGCCKETKPLSEYNLATGRRDGKYSRCRSCSKSKDQESYLLDREKTIIRVKARQLTHPREALDAKRKRLFGVSPEDFDQIVLNQGGKCAICKESFIKTPHIDHDHATGKIRGVLCGTCNPGLGLFKDSPEKLRAAAEYIERT